MTSNPLPVQTAQKEALIDFPTLFARQLARTPDHISMVFEQTSFSYRELDALSERFKISVLSANANAGQTKDQCVGICVDKSPQAIAAMLGVLKAGMAFVPLDPDYPVDRIAFMVEDAAISTIIAQDNHQANIGSILDEQLKQANGEAIDWISSDNPTAAISETAVSALPQQIEIAPSDLAYIMYTSGSTGKPKGVQIEHTALATYCYADIERYQVTAEDRTLQFSTINFDIAIEEIFPPLLVGGSVVIRPAQRSEKLNELSAIINDYQVTAVHIATAYWHEWVDLMVASKDQIPASLRLMVVTGEKVSTTHYQHWKTLCQQSGLDVLWCNAYGPTEATVSASVFIPSESFTDDNMPIGKPLKRYTAMIVDEDYTELPVGETGQLLIGGPALARGYLNRPELNEKAFIELEQSDKNGNKTTTRQYKTGDLARWLPNGDIEFAGRIDHQIKLGSYRIEPGEIEAAINHHTKVLESLISYDEVDSKKSLIGYVAIGQEAYEQKSVSVTDITEFLDSKLPTYMVPSRYVFVASFPKTTNGKIDRKALPDPSKSESASSLSFVAANSKTEQLLASIWQDVLNLPKVGIHNDFFALGGSSLLAVGIVSRIVQEMQIELPVRDFFANPTIATQAQHIDRLLAEKNGDEYIAHDNTDQASIELRKRLPQLMPMYFDRDEERLFGMYYPSQAHSQSRSHGVLICHPLGHEYARAYRNLQQFSILLSQAGYDVFRFDYTGVGNSSGQSESATTSDYVADIKAAAAQLREQGQCEQLSVITLRMGAPLAMSAGIDELSNLILWDPVIRGADYIQMLQGFHNDALTKLERFRLKRQSDNANQLYGYAMSQAQRDSLINLNTSCDKPLSEATVIAKRQVIVTSADYPQSEPHCSELINHCEHMPTNDDIRWHDRLFAESAFSSPEAYKVMMNILEGDH